MGILFVVALHTCFIDMCFSVMPLGQDPVSHDECRALAPLIVMAWEHDHPHWTATAPECVPLPARS